MGTVKKKSTQFRLRTLRLIVAILTLAMSLSLFSVLAFAEGEPDVDAGSPGASAENVSAGTGSESSGGGDSSTGDNSGSDAVAAGTDSGSGSASDASSGDSSSSGDTSAVSTSVDTTASGNTGSGDVSEGSDSGSGDTSTGNTSGATASASGNIDSGNSDGEDASDGGSSSSGDTSTGNTSGATASASDNTDGANGAGEDTSGSSTSSQSNTDGNSNAGNTGSGDTYVGNSGDGSGNSSSETASETTDVIDASRFSLLPTSSEEGSGESSDGEDSDDTSAAEEDSASEEAPVPMMLLAGSNADDSGTTENSDSDSSEGEDSGADLIQSGDGTVSTENGDGSVSADAFEIYTDADAATETKVEAEVKTATETVKVATANVALNENEENTVLQNAIDNAVSGAEEGVKRVLLSKDEKYEDGCATLTSDISIKKYIFECKEEGSTVTVNADIAVDSNIIVELINVLFGEKCALIVENDAELTLGTEDKRFTGNARIAAGAADEEGSITSGKAKVYAGDKASITTELSGDGSKVEVYNSSGDCLTFSDNTTISISSNKEEGTEDVCTVTISAKENVTVSAVNAWDADVTVKAPKVTVNKASNKNENYCRSFKVIAAGTNSAIISIKESTMLGEILNKYGVADPLNVVAPVDKAEVMIKAGITAKKDITVYSYITQEGYLLNSLFANIACNVKVGKALITVDPGVTLKAGNDITLMSTVRASAGYDKSGAVKASSLPLAFNVFVENTSINFGSNVNLTAGRNITADALSTVNAGAYCSYGKSPVNIAFNVVVNNASVNATNVKMNATGNVSLVSKAVTNAIAKAKHGTDTTRTDGMYFATNVIVQDSEVLVGNGTTIVAGGDVTVDSTSDINASDDAIATTGAETQSVIAAPTMQSVFTKIAKRLLGDIVGEVLGATVIKKIFSEEEAEEIKKLAESASAFFDTDGYTIELDSASLEKGTVKASAKSGVLSVTVSSKYAVDQVLVRYLPTGSNEYKFVKATKNSTTGKYELNLADITDVTLPEFRVYVVYGDQVTEADQLGESPVSNDDDDDDDGFTLADLFDQALEATSDDSDSDSDCGGAINLLTKYTNEQGEEKSDLGIIVTDAMCSGVSAMTTNIMSLSGLAAGKNVRINANPASGYMIKSMQYVVGEESETNKPVAIERNNAGHFVFTVPEGLTAGTNLTITAVFAVKSETDAYKSTPSTKQVTGSLGVGVIVNHNDAIVDLGTNGYITAGGKVNVNAEATSNISGTADGTSISEDDIGKSAKVKQPGSGAEIVPKTVYILDEKQQRTNEILYVFGDGYLSTATATGTIYTVILYPNSLKGYTLPDSITVHVIGEDNRDHAIAVPKLTEQEGVGIYSVDMTKIDFVNNVITDVVQTANYQYTEKYFVAEYGEHVYAVNVDKPAHGSVFVDTVAVRGTDTITVTETPDSGYACGTPMLIYFYMDGEELKFGFSPFRSAGNNQYTLELPEDSVLSKWIPDTMLVMASFEKITEEQQHSVSVHETVKQALTVDKTLVSSGEKVTIKLTSGMENYLIDYSKLKVYYKNSKDEEIIISVDPTDFSFIAPAVDATDITVDSIGDAVAVKLNNPIEITPAANGTITVNNGKTCTGGGDTLYITITPETGYALKPETLKAVFSNETITIGKPVQVDGNIYKIIIPTEVGGTGEGKSSTGKITISCEFEKNDSESTSCSVGVAVSVNVGVHKNNALIKSGTVNAAKGISVKAITNGSGATEALAGYSSGKTGVAGALAVSVINFKTNSAIYKAATIGSSGQAEHELSVVAKANITSLKTNADSSGFRYSISGDDPHAGTAKSGATGVGTAIAVAVNGISTNAYIEDGTKTNYAVNFQKATVSAENALASDSVTAKSGAKSAKTAVTPVVALDVFGSIAKAYLGQLSSALNVSEANVTAKNSVAHTMDVNAASAADKAAMAGTFGINVLTDTASAILNCDILGAETKLTVDSESISIVTATSKASSTGASKGTKSIDDSKGSADQKADNIITSGQKLAAKTGSEAAAPTADSVQNRQQAQTSEGAIAGAAAFMLNIQKNRSESTVKDGINIGSAAYKVGDVIVASRSNTKSSITANASAVTDTMLEKSKTGIGVAVAINIVNSYNIAYLGTGNLNAGNVSVTALASKAEDGTDTVDTFEVNTISGSSASSISVAGSVGLAVLNNTTSAKITKALNDVYKAASTTLLAMNTRTASVTASAAATKEGKADKNDLKAYRSSDPSADVGKSVGVGASFAMIYGDNSVTAIFTAPKEADAGTIDIEAVSDHSEESTSVAGSDPYLALCNPTQYDYTGVGTNIAVDAAVAVNAIQSEVIAQLTPVKDGTSLVNAVKVKINASEKGHSKTDSSGYALGGKTAVGGSVAINLNKATVRANNECSLKVSGDDSSSDGGEVHRSVEITASSNVTEENLSYASAAGTDILRYITKYKSLLQKCSAFTEKLTMVTQIVQFLSSVIQDIKNGKILDQLKVIFAQEINAYNAAKSAIQIEIQMYGKAKQDFSEFKSTVSNSGNSLQEKILKLIPGIEDVIIMGAMALSLGSAISTLLKIVTPSSTSTDAATKKATDESKKEINGSSSGKSELSNNAELNKQEESLQVAAAIGVSVSRHTVIAENKGTVETVGSAEISALNTVDAIAHATGSAASYNAGGGSIALAIAVKVDKNVTTAVSTKNITVGKDSDVIISANLKENTNNYSESTTGTKTDFTSVISTQAMAGAVAGDAKVAISGAVVVYVSNATTTAELADNAVIKAINNARAGAVIINAEETVRQTMRTFALSTSSANLSLGISAGVMTSKNVTTARVGKNANIKANSITVNAERKSVCKDTDTGVTVVTKEGKPGYGKEDKESDGSEDSQSSTNEVSVGGVLGDIFKINSEYSLEQGKQVVTVSINHEKLTELLMNVLNSFAGVDYYMAIDAGSVATNGYSASDQIGAVAAACGVAVLNNTVMAIVDEGAVLDSEGDVDVTAVSREHTRFISGCVSATEQSVVSIGAVIAFLYENNDIEALVKDGAVITSGGDLTVVAENAGRSEVYTVTASGSEKVTVAVAATIDVIVSEAKVIAQLGNPGTDKKHTAVTAQVIAKNTKNLRNFTVSLTKSGNSMFQVGGAVAVIIENSSATVNADSTKLYVTAKPIAYKESTAYAEDSIVFSAMNTHDVFVIVASASSTKNAKTNVAGVLSVIVDTSSAVVNALGSTLYSNKAGVNEKAGNVYIYAMNNSTLMNINLQVSINTGSESIATVGAAITTNVLRRTAAVNISSADKPTTIDVVNGDVSVITDATDKVIIVAAGANGASGTASIQGTVVVIVENNTCKVNADKITVKTTSLGLEIQTVGDVTIKAFYDGGFYGIAGSANFSSASLAAGGTVLTVVTSNITEVNLRDSNIDATRTVYILSNSDSKSLLISVGCATASDVAVEGAVVTAVAKDNIYIHLGASTIHGVSLTIYALGNSSDNLITGAVAASGTIAVGPSILVFVKQRNIVIDSTAGGSIGGANGCSADILAKADDDMATLVLAMAGSGKASVSAGILVETINNSVTCDIKSDINAGQGDITIAAKDDREAYNFVLGGGFGGSASVVPVVSVVYLNSKTNASASGVLKGNHISVKADSSLNLRESAHGAAIGGVAGIGGSFIIVVNKGETVAKFTGSYVSTAAGSKLDVLANDNYIFNSLITTLSFSGTAAVSVAAAVTVVKNKVLAVVGDEDGTDAKDVTASTVNVSAKSNRKIKNLAVVLTVAGVAGVTVNISVVVAGSKLPQDAYNMLTEPSGKGKGTTFNAESVLAAINRNAYVQNLDYAKDLTLTEDIQGNGIKDSDTKGSDVDGSEIVSGLDDDEIQDYTASDNNATEQSVSRGENSTIDPTANDSVKKNTEVAESAGYTYNDTNANLEAGVTALVRNVNITASELNITAEEIQTASLNFINAAGGLTAGVAVGVTVMVLHSTVSAELASTANVICNTLNITAYSGTGEGDEKEILLIGGVAGIGGVGVGVAVTVAHLDSVVSALLAGNVTAAKVSGGHNNTINVIAESYYKNVSVQTIAIGGGAVGVSASVAVVSLNGTVQAVIRGNVKSARDTSGNITAGFYNINVLVFFNNSISAQAATMSAGLGAVALGVAVASETLEIYAGIESSASVELESLDSALKPFLNVMAAGSYDKSLGQVKQGTASATAQIGSASAGATAAGAAVAVALLKPTVKSYIDGIVNSTRGGLTVTVGNNIYTKANSGLASVTAGSIASFGANVILAINNSQVSSTVTGTVHAAILNVVSLLSANAVSDMLSSSSGTLSIGVSTAIAILNANNEASVGTGANIGVETLNILAGAASTGDYQDGANFFTSATLLSGIEVAKFAVKLNVAVAINKAVNKANLKTNGLVRANNINVFAYGNPTSSAATKKAELSAGSANGSAAASTLTFTQLVEIECSNLKSYNSSANPAIRAGSYMYPGKAKNLDGSDLGSDTFQATSSVDIFSIAGLSAKANVSYAKNNTTSKVTAKFLTPVGSVSLTNSGSANAHAQVVDSGAKAAGIGANVVLSYVQAKFITLLETNGITGDVNLKTDFVSDAQSTSKSASFSLAELNTNVIIAKSTTSGSTVFDGNNQSVEAKNISVVTLGQSTTKAAMIKPLNVSFGVITIAANVIEAILRTTQEAIFRNAALLGTPVITVNSDLNATNRNKPYNAWAVYEGAPDASSVNLGDVKVNVIIARNAAQNSALVSGLTGSGKITSLSVYATNKSSAMADAGGKVTGDMSATLLGVGVIVSIASNDSSNIAKIEKVSANIATLNLIANLTEGYAKSIGGISSKGAMKLVGLTVNVSTATNNAVNHAWLDLCGTETAKAAFDKVTVRATAENVYASAYIGSAQVSLSGVTILANAVKAINNYSGTAEVTDSYLKGSSFNVESLENRYYSQNGYNALTDAFVGSTGTTHDMTSSIVDVTVSTGTAKNISEVRAMVANSALFDYAAVILADGRSDVKANITSPDKVCMLNVGVICTEAAANGVVIASFEPSAVESVLASLTIKAMGEATANATTGVAGSINVGLVEIGANTAKSSVELLTQALLNLGRLTVNGRTEITGVASSVSTAEALPPNFSLTLVSVNVNKATATNNLSVLSVINPGEYNFNGGLSAAARLADDGEYKYTVAGQNVNFVKASTTAAVHPSLASKDTDGASAGVSLLGAGVHTADATSTRRAAVIIGDGENLNSGTIKASAISLLAVGNGETHAMAQDKAAAIGLFTGGGSYATATSNDTTEIILNTENINVTGSFDATAQNKFTGNSTDSNATVWAEGTTPGAISLVSVMKAAMKATLNNKAKISVAGNITAGSVSFTAKDAGKGKTNLLGRDSKTAGLLTVKDMTVDVNETLNAEILFNTNSKVNANTVTLTTGSDAYSRSEVTQATSAAAIDATVLKGTTTVTSNNKVTLKDNANVTASSALNVTMAHSGKISSFSDFNCSFALIGGNTINANNTWTANNTFSMGAGSSMTSSNGNITVKQSSSGISAEAHSDTTAKAGIAIAGSYGTNTIHENNDLTFNALKAAGKLSVYQYGGATNTDAYGSAYLVAGIGSSKLKGYNNLTVTNNVTALNNASMNAADLFIAQGTDKLELNAGARPTTSGLFTKTSGGADNTVLIYNNLKDGTGDIGSGANSRTFLSAIDASGYIKCEMRSPDGFSIDFGSPDSNNTLKVNATRSAAFNGFAMYRNEFNAANITGDEKPVIEYLPQGLFPYPPKKAEEPQSSSGTGTLTGSATETKSTNSFVTTFIDRLLKSGRNLIPGEISYTLSDDNVLTVYNSALFASNLCDLDIYWVYDFMTNSNVEYKVSSGLESLDLNSTLYSFVENSAAAYAFDIDTDTISFHITQNGIDYYCVVVFDWSTGIASTYIIKDGKLIPATILAIELDGVMNVILCEEQENTESAFILIPDLVDGDLPEIQVKLRGELVSSLKQAKLLAA